MNLGHDPPYHPQIVEIGVYFFRQGIAGLPYFILQGDYVIERRRVGEGVYLSCEERIVAPFSEEPPYPHDLRYQLIISTVSYLDKSNTIITIIRYDSIHRIVSDDVEIPIKK